MFGHRNRVDRECRILALDGIERLQSRQMLTGMVNMTITGGGDIVLRGDAADNEVVVELEFVNAELIGTVTGLNGTSIRLNGQISSTQEFPLVVHELDPLQLSRTIERDLRVNLGAGDDSFAFVPFQPLGGAGMNVGRNVTINMGSGNDSVFYAGLGGTEEILDGLPVFRPTTFALGRTNINTGSGYDNVLVSRVLLDDFRVNTGSATDDVMPDSVVVLNSSAIEIDLRGGAQHTELHVHGLLAGQLKMSGGSGNDSISMNNVIAFEDVRLDLGSESNQVYNGYHDISVGNSRITGDLDVRGAGGIQAVTFESGPNGLIVSGETRINLGGGNDRLHIENTGPTSFVGDFSASMGTGNDRLFVQGKTTFFADATFALQGGADLLAFQYTPLEDGLFRANVRGQLLILGGGGEDTVTDLDFITILGSFENNSIENQS